MLKIGVRKTIPVLLMAVTLLGGACGRFTGGDLDHNTDYIHAHNAAAAGDFHVAAAFYNKALLAFPDSGKAHLELGQLCDEKLGDPIAAIYHYRQFLVLDPNSEHRQMVEGYVDRAKLALAAKLPSSSGADPAELMRLQMENSTLRTRVAELERAATTLPPVSNPSPAPPSAVVASNLPTTPTPSGRTHIVQKGDTLQSLALRYYGTRSAWEKIFAANRTILSSKDHLKIGQQLVIP